MTADTNASDQARPIPDELAILPLRSAVMFPHAVVPLAAGRASSVRLVEDAVQHGGLVGAVLQRDPAEESPGEKVRIAQRHLVPKQAGEQIRSNQSISATFRQALEPARRRRLTLVA